MYLIYLGFGDTFWSIARFDYEDYRPAKTMSPSMCQWIVPGTVDPKDD